VLSKLDGVIFLANSGCDTRFDDLRRALAVGAAFHVIPNALSPAAARALEESQLPFLERDRLIAVGSYQWQKGFDFVLRAYASSNACNKIPLHFFGQKHTDFCRKLHKQTKVLGIDPAYVFFHEGVSEELLQAEYSRARLVLSGSYTECQPLALLDASASATPFVARSTGCIESMPGGVAVKNYSEMTKQINEFIVNPEYWGFFSQLALAAASNLYHPDAIAKQLVAVLEG
jgi:glycosyltransferase involved in cell wall biosynthesis